MPSGEKPAGFLTAILNFADRYNLTAVKVQFLLVGAGVLLLAVSTTLSILKVRSEYRAAISDYSGALFYATQIDLEFSRLLNVLDRYEDLQPADARFPERRRAVNQQFEILKEKFPVLSHGMKLVGGGQENKIDQSLDKLGQVVQETELILGRNNLPELSTLVAQKAAIIDALRPFRDIIETKGVRSQDPTLGRQDRIEPFFEDMLLYAIGTFIGGIFLILILIRQIKITHRSAAAVEQARQETDQAMREAEEANRAKSYFLAVMSHEIRTPMNGVLGTTSLLADGTLSTQQRDYVETIQRSGEALLTILNDILDFSKLEAGHIDLETISFEPLSLVEEVVNLFAQQANEKGIELGVEADSAVPRSLVGDPGRIRQILLNLIGNAVKFTETGGVTVRLSVAETTDDFSLVISVSDTGIGVPPDRRQSLFQEFFQAEASVSRKYGGTGLGLAICKRLVELMGGEISYRPNTDVDGGSEFSARIPCSLDASLIADPEQPVQFPDASALVICDNRILSENISWHLRRCGIDADFASTADEAIERLKSGAFQLIVIDAQLAGLRLVEFGKQLDGIDKSLRKRTLVTVGTAGSMRGSDIRRQGFPSPVRKPLRHQDVISNLRQILLGEMPPTEKLQPATPAHLSGAQDPAPGTKLLLAEDGEINRKVATVMLERAGYTVEGVEDGAAALTAVESGDYDLILMDLHMPDVDGFAATAAIRSMDGPKSRIPIVALTANALMDSRQACLDAGMNGFITKPINRETMLTTIAEVLAAQRNLDEFGSESGKPAELEIHPSIITDEVAAAAAPAGVIDQAVLTQFGRDVGDDNLAALLEDFETESRRLLEQVQAAVEGKAFNAAGRFTHSLKSSAGTIGAIELEAVGARMETACFERQEDQIADLIEELKQAVENALAALRAVMASRASETASRAARSPQIRAG